MKKSFSTGLIILLPFALTIGVVWQLLNLLTDPALALIAKLLLWLEQTHPGLSLLHHAPLLSRLAALLLTLLFITLLGFLGRKFFFDSLLRSANRMMFKIPIIGGLYRLLKEIIKSVLSTDKKTFQETVLVPFPSAEMYTIGFITSSVPLSIQTSLPHTDVTVFIPTAPHPISGYLLFCPKHALHPTSISIEEAFKFFLSCGVIHPSKK